MPSLGALGFLRSGGVAEHIDVALRATSKLADSALVALLLVDFERIIVAAPSYLEEQAAPKRAEDVGAHQIVQLGQARTASTIVLRTAAPQRAHAASPKAFNP